MHKIFLQLYIIKFYHWVLCEHLHAVLTGWNVYTWVGNLLLLLGIIHDAVQRSQTELRHSHQPCRQKGVQIKVMTACTEELSKGSEMAQSLVNYRNLLFTNTMYSILSSTVLGFLGVIIHQCMNSTVQSLVFRAAISSYDHLGKGCPHPNKKKKRDLSLFLNDDSYWTLPYWHIPVNYECTLLVNSSTHWT